MADDVTLKFGAQIQGLVDGIDKINQSINGLKRTVEGLSGQFLRSFEEEFIKLLSVDAIGRFISSMGELGEKTKRTAEIFGITTEQVAELDLIAKTTGSSGEALTRTLERLSLVLSQSADRATPAAAALHALGLNAQEISKLGLFEMLDKLREAFQKLPEGMRATAIAQALVRNGAEVLVPILRLSNKEWNDLLTASKNTGAEMSQRVANSFALTATKLDIMQQSILGVAIRLFDVLRPAIDAAIDGITKFVQSLDPSKLRSMVLNFVDFAAQVIVTIGKLAIDVGAIIDEVVRKIGGIARLLEAAGGGAAIGAVLGVGVGGVGAVGGAIVGGTVSVVAALIENMNKEVDKQLDHTEESKARFEALIKGFQSDIKGSIAQSAIGDMFANDFGDTDGGKAKGQAPGLDIAGLSKMQQFEQTMRGAMEAAKGIDVLRESMTMGAYESAFFTTQQKLLSQATIAGIPITKSLRTAIDAVADATAQATVRMQHFQQVQDALQQLAQGITGAFMSWIHGTKSLGQAFLELAVQIAEAVIEALILDAILAALGLAMPTAGLGGLFAGLFGGGGSVGAPMNIVPPGLATGAWDIPNDMLAMVHKGEMVVPAAQAEQMRSSGGGGGYVFAPVIQALDASGVDRVLQKHGRAFAKMVAGQWNHNPSIRPKY